MLVTVFFWLFLYFVYKCWFQNVTRTIGGYNQVTTLHTNTFFLSTKNAIVCICFATLQQNPPSRL